MSDSPSVPAWSHEWTGDEVVFTWPADRLAIGLDVLREEKDGLVGEIRIKEVSNQAEWHTRKGHIHWAKFNLSSTTARTTLAKAMQARAEHIDWATRLEIVCEITRGDYRRGEPVIDLATVVPTPQSYLIDKVLPKGETSIVYGDGASLKSVSALFCATAAATGGQVGPFRATEKVNVMLLDWETNPDEQSERLNRIAAGLGMDGAPHIFYRMQYRPLADDIRTVKQEIARLDVGFVVVDSIAPACGGDVSAEVAVPFFNALRSLGSGVTRLIISHVTHETAKSDFKGPGRPFGSTFVRNLSRSAWEFRRDPNSPNETPEIGIFHRKVNRGFLQADMGIRVHFDDPTGPITVERMDLLEHSSLGEHASLGSRIRGALRHGALTYAELAENLGVDAEVVRKTASKMSDIERINNPAGGRGNVARVGLKARDDMRF